MDNSEYILLLELNFLFQYDDYLKNLYSTTFAIHLAWVGGCNDIVLLRSSCCRCRLLDVCPGRRSHREMKLMLVFEHIDQDLSQFLEKVPSPGLGPDRIRVSLISVHLFYKNFVMNLV